MRVNIHSVNVNSFLRVGLFKVFIFSAYVVYSVCLSHIWSVLEVSLTCLSTLQLSPRSARGSSLSTGIKSIYGPEWLLEEKALNRTVFLHANF